jgi:cytidylate kinase
MADDRRQVRPKKLKIAIDGPAGAGKSSVAKIIADKLTQQWSANSKDITFSTAQQKLEYIDSGALYRAITKIFLDNNFDIDNAEQIRGLLSDIELSLDGGHVFINGKDLTGEIRTADVTKNVSFVSSNIDVRNKVNSFLNKYSADKSVIMDGRDIGTVVFPDADYKFYLDASIEVRAQRRFAEKNNAMTLEEIAANIAKRDENDKKKKIGALKIAEDAIYIDTTKLNIEDVVQKILTIINNNGEEHGV